METNNNTTAATQSPPPAQPETRPQERGTIQIDASLKIFDPKTGEIHLEGRG